MSNLTIREHEKTTYPPRTYYNATQSGTTLALAVDLTTAGEVLTKKMAGKKYIGFKLSTNLFAEEVAEKVIEKMKADGSTTLNIAGNGEYTLKEYGYNQADINEFVYHVVKNIHDQYPLTKIFTGGQTGADMAGAVAGAALGIETEVTLPKGFMQKLASGKTVWNTQKQVEDQVLNGVKSLSVNQKRSKLRM